ncbi:MAG: STAS domain-containing protein [Anaerolineales bacterium]|jgi:anti-anti-sigma factor
MDLLIKVYKRVAAVQPKGRVDSNTAPELEEALVKLQGEGQNHIVLDLSEIEFLSSAGLRVMVSTMKNLRKSAGDLVVASPNQRARDVLRLAGLDSVFSIYETREAAIASI